MSFLNVPKLRFPEFTDDWEYKQFNELFEFIQTNSLSRANLNYENGKVKNIHYGDIHTKFPTILDCEKFEIPFINPDVNLEKIKDESFCKNGDIVIADASEDYDDIGKAIELKNVNNTKLLAGLHTFLARDQNGFTIEGYRGYMLLNNNFKLQIKKIATGISVLGISKTNLGKLNINIPSIQEQEKIASFLSQVDSKIEKLEKKVELWETYKKGMMQQIFSQKLRFKDENGEEYPEWKETLLGDIGNNYTGLSGKTKEDFGKGSPFITYKSIFDKNKIDLVRLEYVDVKDSEKQNTVDYGDIFFTTSSETPEEVGMASVLLDKIEGCYLNSFCFGFRLNSFEDTSPEFMSFYLRSPLIRNEIKKLAQGSTRFNLSKKEMMKLRLKIPSIQEQLKIANLFSNIDLKLHSMVKDIENNKEFKRGLLQKIFC